LLLSPALGSAIAEKHMLFSRPPRKKTLHQPVARQTLGMPDHLKIVTGAKKNCDPALAKLIGAQLGFSISILPNERHMLESSSVKGALNRFLPTEGVLP